MVSATRESSMVPATIVGGRTACSHARIGGRFPVIYSGPKESAMSYRSSMKRIFAATLAAGVLAAVASAQGGYSLAGGRGRGPTVVSPELMPDGRVVFRIAAPKAEKVTLS